MSQEGGSHNLYKGKQELNGTEVSDYMYIYGISLLTKQEAKAYVWGYNILC